MLWGSRLALAARSSLYGAERLRAAEYAHTWLATENAMGFGQGGKHDSSV